MIKRLSSLALAAILIGCSTVQFAPEPDPAPEPIERVPGEDTPCNAAPAQQYVGQKATQSVGEQIVSATGAGIFQWVPPNSAVTMDYRIDRVRVGYDAEMTITTIRCG